MNLKSAREQLKKKSAREPSQTAREHMTIAPKRNIMPLNKWSTFSTINTPQECMKQRKVHILSSGDCCKVVTPRPHLIS